MSFGKTYELAIEGYIYDGWFVLREYEEYYYKPFLLQLLNSDCVRKQYDRLSAGGIVLNISSEIVNKTILFHTSHQEQEKIATFLSLLDARISTQSQIIEKYESLIKGLNNELHSQKLRFKDECENDFAIWNIKSFNEVLMSVPTKKNQIQRAEYLNVGKYKVVDQGQELIAGYSDREENVFYDLPVIVFGDHTTILKYVDFPFIVGADGTKLIKAQNKDNLKYLYYNLIFNNVRQDGYKRHFTMLSGLHFYIPSIEEQNEIANFLSTIDEKLEIERQILKRYTDQKKYLLRNMFI